ncbi:MAG: ribonuclease Z [Dehalococcoidia bacterium]
MTTFEVILLGTGSPLPSNERCGGAQLVLSGEQAVLIDCGWGAARRLMAAGVPLPRVDTVCFTHMHSDHITDLPDFLIMRWTGGATNPLSIYGPEGTRVMVEGFLAGLAPDIGFRFAHHGEKLSREGIQCVVHEIPATPDVSHAVTIGELEIGAFEVDHWPVKPALGFHVRRGGASVVFSGDTKRCETLGRAAAGADVLVCEALHAGMMMDRVRFLRARGDERLAQILEEACEYHISPVAAAELARDAGVKRLVLTHIIPPIPNEGPAVEQFMAGMSDVFAGEIIVGRDLQRITVEE